MLCSRCVSSLNCAFAVIVYLRSAFAVSVVKMFQFIGTGRVKSEWKASIAELQNKTSTSLKINGLDGRYT